MLVDAGSCGRAEATWCTGGAGACVWRDQHVVHQLLLAVGGGRGLGTRGCAVLFSVFVEVEGLANCSCVVVIGGLRVHTVLRPSRTDAQVVWCEDEAVVGCCGTRRCGLNLQIQMVALWIVTSA